jgi:DNA-binding IclR family transcriptional regulator
MRHDPEISTGTGTLGKAVSVLEMVAEADAPLRFTEILARSGQPRGTLHRQLSHLVEEGLLDMVRDFGYVPGLRLLKLAARAWERNEFRTIAEPHLRALHRLTGETVHLGVLRGSEIIYLDKVESRQSVRMYSQIGNASPVYCTGVGKAALSALTESDRMALVENLTFKPFTATTHGNRQSLLAEIAVIETCGHAFDREEHETGIRCVAAPIWSEDRAFVAGISVTGPSYRVTMAQLQDWAENVRDAAARIMADMAVRLGPRR